MGDCGLALAMRQLVGRRAAVLVSFQSERVWSFDGADLDTIAFEERRSRCVVRGSVERCLTPGFGQYQRPDLCCSRGRAVSRREPRGLLLVVVSGISDGGVGEDFCIPGERERGERGLTRR
jgi:hypothetical protein